MTALAALKAIFDSLGHVLRIQLLQIPSQKIESSVSSIIGFSQTEHKLRECLLTPVDLCGFFDLQSCFLFEVAASLLLSLIVVLEVLLLSWLLVDQVGINSIDDQLSNCREVWRFTCLRSTWRCSDILLGVFWRTFEGPSVISIAPFAELVCMVQIQILVLHHRFPFNHTLRIYLSMVQISTRFMSTK